MAKDFNVSGERLLAHKCHGVPRMGELIRLTIYSKDPDVNFSEFDVSGQFLPFSHVSGT